MVSPSIFGGKMKRSILMILLSLLLLSCVSCGSSKKKDIDDLNNNIGHDPGISSTPTQPGESVDTPVYELYISELMANNTRLYLGTDADWIEIGSRENRVVSLNGYFLTDNLEKPYAFPLAGNVIAENGYVVVLLSEDAPFHLNGEGETVYLICNGEPVDSITYTKEIGDRSASKDGLLPYATPGYPNTQEGYDAYLAGVVLPDLVFSEAIASNTKYLAVGGKYYDIIELYNNSKQAVNLGDFYMSDKRSNLTKFQLPNHMLGAGEYYTIYCSGLTEEGHAPFKISAGETVYLSDGRTMLDMIEIPDDLEENKSYGRFGNVFVYMEEPTPGTKNNSGYVSRVKIPTPSMEPGLYSQTITVALSGEGTIFYTLDGSHPTESSSVYSGPITIDGVTTIRTFAKSGNRVSELGAYTYLVGIEHTLPVVYVSIPNRYVTGSEGIVTNKAKTIEKECVLSLYEDGKMKFSVPCGFRLHGNDSRNGAKQNFQLRFRSQYGLGRFKYKLFDDLDINSFDSLLLKGGSEDYPYAMIRDEFCTGLVNGTTHLYVLACKPCVLYLGDQYWGIYYLRERFSDDYVADHFDVSKKSVDLLFSYSAVQAGSAKDYNSLLSFVRKNDMTVEANYQKAIDQIDPLSLMDWYICRSYMGDKDVANIRYFRSTEYDSKWRWMYFDLDWAFWHTTDKPITGFIKNDDHNILMYNLLKNKNFRDMFLKRYAELMDTILNEQYITDALDKFIAVIEPEIPKDRERWGYSVSGWNNAVQKMYNYVKGGARTDNVLRDIKSYFGLTDDQMKYYFGKHWK